MGQIYLDYNASTPVDSHVAHAMRAALEDSYGRGRIDRLGVPLRASRSLARAARHGGIRAHRHGRNTIQSRPHNHRRRDHRGGRSSLGFSAAHLTVATASDTSRRKRCRARRSDEVRGLRLRGESSAPECTDSCVTCIDSGITGQRKGRDQQPGNDSTLKWEPSSDASGYEGHLAGYEQSRMGARSESRKCHEHHAQTLQDNVIFAVRAVDREGYRSLPVVPLPER
jgi:hypothetical protein